MATFANRITDLIGSEYTTIASNSVDDLFNAAANEMADSLPTDLLLKYSAHQTSVTSDAGMDASEEKKLLLVQREVSNSGTEARKCRAIPFDEFMRVQNVDSIYYATVESPVYAYDPTASNDVKIKIFPTPTAQQAATVFHFNYITGSNTGNSTVSGLPDMAMQAVVLKTCINILQTYISDFCQDEEDQEMLNMLNGQISTLASLYQKELARFMEPDATPRGE